MFVGNFVTAISVVHLIIEHDFQKHLLSDHGGALFCDHQHLSCPVCFCKSNVVLEKMGSEKPMPPGQMDESLILPCLAVHDRATLLWAHGNVYMACHLIPTIISVIMKVLAS